MEKKIKKLQLRKETIAVLNGERMAHVVGGTGNGCLFNGGHYLDGEQVHIDEGQVCYCVNGNVVCQPEGTIILDTAYCTSKFDGCKRCETQ